MKPHVIFVDLHGVIVNSKLIFQKYRQLTIRHLMDDFDLQEESATQRYDSAYSTWETKAYSFLKDSKTPKEGEKFLDFLRKNDEVFSECLYSGLDTSDVEDGNLRHKPFEYNVACRIEALYPEVRDILNELTEEGYVLHAASSNFSGHIKGILRANMIEHLFDSVIGFDDVASTKHTLQFYKRMLKQTRTAPSEAIMLGNSLHEILKPRRLGMTTVHVNRERKVPHDVQRLATIRLRNLRSLPLKLENLR